MDGTLRKTPDDCTRCYSCKTWLGEGEFAWDMADHWICRFCMPDRARESTCTVCHEPVTSTDGVHWTHRHGSESCGTGDGATAIPAESLVAAD